jgi:hypothetical protein
MVISKVIADSCPQLLTFDGIEPGVRRANRPVSMTTSAPPEWSFRAKIYRWVVTELSEQFCFKIAAVLYCGKGTQPIALAFFFEGTGASVDHSCSSICPLF